MFNIKEGLAFIGLFLMLGIILVPSFSALGGLFLYAENAQFYGVSLLAFFQAELVFMCVFWLVLIRYSRRSEILEGDVYVKRHIFLMLFIAGEVLVGVVAGGFLVHQDAAWYQVIRAEDEIMPAQAIILLVCYPMYLFFGGSAFLYARTRLLAFSKNKGFYFMVLTFAPFAFLPYYDSGMFEAVSGVFEVVYLLAYWCLSTAWIAFGVIYLVLQSAKEMLKSFKVPYGEK